MPSIDSTAAELYSTYSDDLCNGIDGALHDKTTDLASCLRADARRFAAYKAHYVETAVKNLLNDEKTPAEQRQANAERAMRTFQRWGQTERNYAVQSTQMAEKWQEFEKDGDRYLLQYRTAHDEKVRATHAALHGVTLPPDDPFWDEYYPPLGWNCRCTVVQVRRGKYPASDSSTSIANGRAATEKTPSFRFNPGKQRKCFPDNVSYLKHANLDTWTKTKPAIRYSIRKQYEGYKQTVDTSIGKVLIDEITMIEVSKGSATDKSYFLKQEIAMNIGKYITKMIELEAEDVDLSHNSKHNIFYERKKQFKTECGMKVYQLNIDENTYIVKFGVFAHYEGYHLYTITG